MYSRVGFGVNGNRIEPPDTLMQVVLVVGAVVGGGGCSCFMYTCVGGEGFESNCSASWFGRHFSSSWQSGDVLMVASVKKTGV